jgi:hypothetical protein
MRPDQGVAASAADVNGVAFFRDQRRGSGANGSAEIFVNSKRTRPDELDAVLPRGLINASHVAYIRADGEVRWSDVVNVIDVLRGLHLDVILLTNRPGGRSAG